MGTLPEPLRSLSKIPLRRRYAMEWKAEVEHWNVDHFSWICPWFRPGDILIRIVIDGLQRQCKKKDQEIEWLGDECANINEKTIRAAKMQKTESDSQLREVSAKIAHLKAEHAKQAQLIKIMQEDLTLTRSEAQQWREVAQ
ncbi:hypothetical protein Fmac_032638 [Flemingia macrophylla]|uniref:Uncharacterized protein n=1 Tax=Flemingia macrophylla TaxID=520843 RepID=A0ABD1L5I7_9FABA